ncbi:hypothetical protein QQ045_026037 [Rhodiola kirilowii]
MDLFGGAVSVRRRWWLGLAAVLLTLLFQAIFIVHTCDAEGAGRRHLLQSSTVPGGLGEKHSEDYCAMYDICGKRSDGKVLNCPKNVPSVKPDDIFSSKIQSLCPTITGNVCCTEAQFDTLRTQVQQAVPLLVGCPACLRNFLNLFCELACSPNQSLFINVTSVAKAGNNMTVDATDFFISDNAGERLYESCKDVKFGTMNMKAMALIGGGAKNFKEFLAFLGLPSALDSPGSAYAIKFSTSVNELSGMKPMNVSTYSCGDTSLGCSCGDCPSSSTCSSSAPSPTHKGSSCSVKLGSLKVKCIDFALAIIYIMLVSLFLGWGVHHRAKKHIPGLKRKSSLEVTNVSHINPSDLQKDDILSTQVHMQLHEDAHEKSHEVQLSIVQGYIASFFRQYGTWIARNPTLVLCSSVVLVLLLCIGLVQFQVEARPEKLWVGTGSRAANEKHFFDNHLAPFYRIEQLIVSTVPDAANVVSPSIVNKDNIKLLFEIQKKVDALQANYSGSVVSLTDICMKPLGKDCATQSVLQYFKMDPKKFDDDTGVDHAEYCFQHFTSADSCLSAFKAPLDPSTALGGFSGNNYSEASAFIVTYPVNNDVNKEGNKTAKAVAWEKAFIKLAKDELLPLVRSKNLKLSFSTESSIEEELKRESTADAMTIVCSYLVMFAYISLMLGDTTHLSLICISSKVLLGLSGILLVMLSVIGSVGFFSAIGVKSTLIIMEVIPFLVLAIAKASLVPESSYIAKPAASWLDDFLVWMSPEAFGCCRKFTNGSYCPPDDQPPCCSPGDTLCSLGEVCKDCTTCFLHSDLQHDRPSTIQFREKLPWFLTALPSSDCAKGGHGAYTNSLDLQGYTSGIIQASEFRTYHTPLNKQADYVNSMKAAREFSSRMSKSLEIEIFPYSVFYMFFEQYLDIWKTALISLSIAIGTIFIVCFAITCSLWSAGIIVLVLMMIIVDLLGVMAILNIQLNAMSVVNLVMSVGIAVEFCVHITHAFSVASGDRDQRAKEALGTMGASVFSGITLTKLVGVIVLSFSKTEVFVVILY